MQGHNNNIYIIYYKYIIIIIMFYVADRLNVGEADRICGGGTDRLHVSRLTDLDCVWEGLSGCFPHLGTVPSNSCLGDLVRCTGKVTHCSCNDYL